MISVNMCGRIFLVYIFKLFSLLFQQLSSGLCFNEIEEVFAQIIEQSFLALAVKTPDNKLVCSLQMLFVSLLMEAKARLLLNRRRKW